MRSAGVVKPFIPADGFARAAGAVAEICALHADTVDREARFPAEAVAIMKEQKLLSMMIPRELGGGGASLAQVAQVCATLGKSCASSAMIFAMHQIKLSSLITHGIDNPWHLGFMRRIAADQLLLGSATTETGIGGDLRNSICAVESAGSKCTLVKDATVISYARNADAILATARSGPSAPSSDQVMVAVTNEQYSLERTTSWDTLGMRGTCSEGFILRAEFAPEQVFPKPFAEIAAQSMLACSHLLWSAAWLGVANGAIMRAQAYVKAEVRKKPDSRPPGMLRLAEASNMLHLMRANILEGLQRFKKAQKNSDELSSVGFAVAMNNIKIASSRMLVEAVNHAMMICGISGYRNDHPYSIARYLRDAHSAPLMISNDRIFSNQGNLLLISRFDSAFDK
jgi:acyl-CoA dehydrogenase